MDMFVKAARRKLRFETPKGLLSMEDLFDLPLSAGAGKANLDDIARSLYTKLKDAETPSFVTPNKGADEDTKLRFDLVLYVIEVKKAEAQTAAMAKETREKKQQIMALIEQKQNEHLAGQSIADLTRMLEDL